MVEKQYLTVEQMKMLNELGVNIEYSAHFADDVYGEPYNFADFIIDKTIKYKYPCYTLGDLISFLINGVQFNDVFYTIEISNKFVKLYKNDEKYELYCEQIDNKNLIDICYNILIFIYTNSSFSAQQIM